MKAGVLVVVLLLISSLSLWPNTPMGTPVSYGSPQPASTVADNFTTAKVLCDESHVGRGSDMWTPGNASMFGWILGQYGYNVSTNWNYSLDSGILLNYQVLCLVFPMVALTESEVTAVRDFVDAGGGLLLVGIEYTTSGWMYTPANLNPISQAYNITFNLNRVIGRAFRSSGQILDHPVTQDVQSFHSKCDEVWGCSLTVTSPATTIGIINGASALAVAQSGSGKVVAIGSPAPIVQYRHDGGWQLNPNDHFQLTLNIIDWLVGNPHRVVEPPEIAIFRIGSGPSMNSSELNNYTLFNGAIHEHTTLSDGGDAPETMAVAALRTGLDYFVLTDHSHMVVGYEGILGALAARSYAQTYELDCPIIVGAELSSIQHTIGFPLTQNIYTTNQSYGVEAIHAQGGIAGMAHPTMDSSEIPVWLAFDAYGYDAFEVTNDGYFQASGEYCYFRNFYGASDSHSAGGLGYVRNVVFVQNPTGPDGALSGADVADAVVDRRIVVLDLHNNMILGQGIWVDRFLDIWDQAETAINNTRNQIASLEGGGLKVGLSRMYLQKAESAMEWWNPSAALQATHDALLPEVMGLDLNTTAPNLGALAPSSSMALSIKLENRLGYGVELNATPFVSTALVFDHPSAEVIAGPSSTHVTDLTGVTSSFGYTNVMLNLHYFNTTEKPNPIVLQRGGIISSVAVRITNTTQGTSLTIELLVGSRGSLMLANPRISYNNGTPHVASLGFDGEEYYTTLGPYLPGVNVTFQILLDDVLGNSFVIDGGTYRILSNATTTTTTTTVSDPWPLILGIAGAGAILAVVVVLVLFRKKT